jgi:DNA-directed RNA polymerase sigma subunit (sigma70/sigma32)
VSHNPEEDRAISLADISLSQERMRQRLAAMLADLTPRERVVLEQRFQGADAGDVSRKPAPR